MKFIRVVKAKKYTIYEIDDAVSPAWEKYARKFTDPIKRYLETNYPQAYTYSHIYQSASVVCNLHEVKDATKLAKQITKELKANFDGIKISLSYTDPISLTIKSDSYLTFNNFRDNYIKKNNIKIKEDEEDDEVDLSPSNFYNYLSQCEPEELVLACKYLRITPYQMTGESGLDYDGMYVEDMLDAIEEKVTTDDLKVKVMKRIEKDRY